MTKNFLLLYCALCFVNVVIQTIKSLCTIKSSTFVSACVNAMDGLQSGDLDTDTQPANISETPPDVDLISEGNRVNSTTANRPRTLEKPGILDSQPVCEVTVSYADEPDDAVVADVLTMLTNAHYGR